MTKWEYAHVPYRRKHRMDEACITSFPAAMSSILESAGLHVDSFLAAAGKEGWELAGTLIPFAAGKTLSAGGDDEDNLSTYTVEESLDIQWLMFKREL